MLAYFQELKGQMNKCREAERERLTKLTLESTAAIKELKRKSDKVRSSEIKHTTEYLMALMSVQQS